VPTESYANSELKALRVRWLRWLTGRHRHQRAVASCTVLNILAG
jgi:hypothetical protein